MARDDGRTAAELRKLACQSGVLSRADGSCRFAMSDTVALAAVHGPMEDPVPRLEQAEQARVEVVLYTSAKTGEQTRDLEAERVLKGVVENVLLARLHPRKLVRVAVQLLHDGGSGLACAVLACSGALLDAGLELSGVPSAACCAVPAEDSERLLLDPNTVEEQAARAWLFVCTATDGDDVLATLSHGRLSREKYRAAVLNCTAGAASARAFLRLSFVESARQRIAAE